MGGIIRPPVNTWWPGPGVLDQAYNVIARALDERLNPVISSFHPPWQKTYLHVLLQYYISLAQNQNNGSAQWESDSQIAEYFRGLLNINSHKKLNLVWHMAKSMEQLVKNEPITNILLT